MKMSGYTSSFLSADDVRKQPRIGHVIACSEEKVGTDNKPVLYVLDEDGTTEHKVALNKTNIARLTTLFGSDESDDWIGEPVVIFCDPSVMFQNKRTGGISFRAPKADYKISKLERAANPESNGHSEEVKVPF